MKSFLLLILSLMAGCEASSDVKGCIDGWVIFTCKYKTCENITVVTPTQVTIPSTQKDVWQDQGRFSVYHDTQHKNVRVAIRNIQREDFGKYKCKFYEESDSNDENEGSESDSKQDKKESESDSEEHKKGSKSDSEEHKKGSKSDSKKDKKGSKSDSKKDKKGRKSDSEEHKKGSKSDSKKDKKGRKSDSDSDDDDDEVEIKCDGSCQRPFIQTAYRTAKTTIPCDYNPNNPRVKFFCKEIGSVCEDILSTKSSLKSNGTFALKETNRGFNVSISDVSSQHTGVYWCGAKSKEGSYRYALKKIQLKVEDITNFTKSPTIGQNLTYFCKYQMGAYPIFICKGEDPSICEPIVSTSPKKLNTEKFSLYENKPKKNITVTVKNVSTEDTGTYWCGAEHTNKTRLFFHKLKMTVGPLAASRSGGPRFPVTAVVLICVALLVLILVLIYKRFQQPKMIEAQKNEERAYEEIQERPQKPGSGTAPKTIYATAEAPTNPTAPQYYSTVNFQNSSKGDGGDTYSTVSDQGQRPVYSTVNPAFRPSEDPFYSTVNMPQPQ